MSFSFIKKLPTPEDIRNEYPVDSAIQTLKEKRDQEIRDVFTGKSDKFLAIIGPCSADNEDAVCDYLLRLRKVQDKISDKVLIIPRVYTNKPRTTGEGYKGMVHQPDPEKKPNMLAGLVAIRKMHIRHSGKRFYLRRRNALSGKLSLSFRPAFLRCSRRPLC